jgi:hypothetical protein
MFKQGDKIWITMTGLSKCIAISFNTYINQVRPTTLNLEIKSFKIT